MRGFANSFCPSFELSNFSVVLVFSSVFAVSAALTPALFPPNMSFHVVVSHSFELCRNYGVFQELRCIPLDGVAWVERGGKAAWAE